MFRCCWFFLGFFLCMILFQIKFKQISCSLYDQSIMKYVSQYARDPNNSRQSTHEKGL